MIEITKIDLYDGKYTVLLSDDGSEFRALRHGEEWRDLCGDGLVLSMVQEIQSLKSRVQEFQVKNLENLIEDLQQPLSGGMTVLDHIKLENPELVQSIRELL